MIVVTTRRRTRPEVCHNEFDGVIQLQDLTGQAQLRDNPLDSDLYAPAEGDNYEYSEAGGLKRMFGNMRANRKEKLAQKRLTKESKAAARTLKAKAKLKKGDAKILGAKAQQEAAKGLGKQDDSATIAALNASQVNAPAESAGMSKNMKIGIGVGIGVVVLIVAVVVYKKMKAKKGK